MAKTKQPKVVRSEIPPHHQSTVAKMGCHVFYAEDQIKKRRQPGGMESARGVQIHRTMSRYASHCKERGVSMDIEAFERFRQGAGPHAAKILANLRDGYQVDHEHLIATERTMRLDKNYQPILLPVLGRAESGTAFEGTLDALYGFPESATMVIEDYKSHPLPYDPADPIYATQGIEYTVFVLMHCDWVQTVVFRLIFVRYRKCTKEVTYTRADLPKLIEALRASRQLQEHIHELWDTGQPLEATPGAHCMYCPLLTPRTCPIAEFNAEMQLSMEDRMRFMLWYRYFSEANTKVMKAHIQATGRSIVVKDGNGMPYRYGPQEAIAKVYPIFERDLNTGGILYDDSGRAVLPIIEQLMDHAHANPEDTEWMLKLVISSTKMNSALKTKTRMHLDQSLKDNVYLVTKTPMKITRPSSEEEEKERQFDEDSDEEDSEEDSEEG